MQCKYRDKLHLLILWKTYEAKSIVQYNRLITLQHGHSRRVRRMKNGGVWRRLAGSLLGTRQLYLCHIVALLLKILEFWKTAAYYSDFRITNIARSKNAVKKNLKKYNFLHPWSNGYDPGLPNRRRRFNSGRMLKNWKIIIMVRKTAANLNMYCLNLHI